MGGPGKNPEGREKKGGTNPHGGREEVKNGRRAGGTSKYWVGIKKKRDENNWKKTSKY